MPEQLRNENLEAEGTPEEQAQKIIEDVLGTAEIQEAVDSIASPEAVQKSRNFISEKAKNFLSVKENWNDTKKYSGVAAGGLLGGVLIVAKIAKGIFDFAKRTIKKKGNITFKEGYEIGKSILDPNAKKDKK